MNKQACIYKIVNVANGDCYVGGTSDIHNRSLCHRSFLRNGNHPNKKLQNAYDEYGADSFRLEIIELIDDVSALEEREQFYSDLLSPVYCNRLKVNSNTGIKMPEESSEKKSKAMFGRRRSDDERKLVSESKSRSNHYAYGKPAQNRGTKQSDEAKKKISETKRKMNVEIAEKIRDLYASGLSTTLLAKKFGISTYSVSGIINNKTYKKVGVV